MHDDLCMASRGNQYNQVKLNCWLPPSHPGEHLDRAFGVWWRAAPQGPATAPKPKRSPLFGRPLPERMPVAVGHG